MKNQNNINLVIVGVGGQGIGMLSEILIRALDHCGCDVKGVDTHGLAQRGGSVVSYIRTGNVNSPLVSKNGADIILALELYESYNALIDYGIKGISKLIYYNTSWQPLGVRLKKENMLHRESIQDLCKKYGIEFFEVKNDSIPDPLMINVAILASLFKEKLIEELSYDSLKSAMYDIMNENTFRKNIDFFDNCI